MRRTVRGILINNGYILLIHRVKPDRDYYSVPGGKIEDEEPEDAVKREFMEELGLVVTDIEFVWMFRSRNFEHNFFRVNTENLEIKTGQGEEYGEEWRKNNGSFKPVWVNLEDISKMDTSPPFLNYILEDICF